MISLLSLFSPLFSFFLCTVKNRWKPIQAVQAATVEERVSGIIRRALDLASDADLAQVDLTDLQKRYKVGSSSFPSCTSA